MPAPYWSIYATVWKALQPLFAKYAADGSPDLERAFTKAHIVSVSPEQVMEVVAALPKDREDQARLLRHVKPPFPLTLLTVGHKFADADKDPWTRTPLYAALICDGDNLQLSNSSGYNLEGQPSVYPIWRSESGACGLAGMGIIPNNEDALVGGPLRYVIEGTVCADLDSFSKLWRGDRPFADEAGDMGASGAAVAFATLMLLESANVDLREPTEKPTFGHRAYRTPAWEVHVRLPSTRRQSVPRGGSIEWTHRWEVRGHYKHFRSGPIFDAHPDRRVMDVDGEPCVRIWCPPYIKGPEDKPFRYRPLVAA